MNFSTAQMRLETYTRVDLEVEVAREQLDKISFALAALQRGTVRNRVFGDRRGR